MRSLFRMTLLPVALVAAACGRTSHGNTAMKDDLKQDLQLASSVMPNIAIAPDEIGPTSSPQPARTLRKARGPKAVRSRRPSVKAAPEQSVAAAETNAPQVEAPAPAPAPQPEPQAEVPATPRPSPVSIPAQGSGPAAGRDDGGTARVIGAVLGGILGAVIRGGGVDGDHCVPNGRRRGGFPGGIYNGYPGGMGGGRYPISRIATAGR